MTIDVEETVIDSSSSSYQPNREFEQATFLARRIVVTITRHL